MYTTLISTALFSFLAARAVHAEFSVQTPSKFIQCDTSLFSWEQTKGPYSVILVNETDPCGEEVAHLGDTDATHISWNVSLAVGYNVIIYVEDDEGEEAWSGAIAVTAGNTTSCLNNTAAVSQHPSSTTTGAHTTSTSGSGVGNAGVGHNGALSARRIPVVPTVILGIVIGLAFALAP